MILVSPAEPPTLRALGTSSAITEDYGADFLIPASDSKLIAVQRKEFPGDFLSSLYDNRLASLAMKITAADMRILLLEGDPVWTNDGQLRLNHGGFGRRFTLDQLRGLLWSLQWEFGVATYWTSGIADTCDFLNQLSTWALKDRHESLHSRSGPGKNGFGRKPSPEDYQSWILQGIEGIGSTLAERLLGFFGGLPLEWTVSEKELLEAPGIGKGKVAAMTAHIPARSEPE